MKMKFIDFFYGRWILCAEGVFPERIINITREKGIFIQNIVRDTDKTILFTVSAKGAMELFASSLPPEITLSVKSRHGLPAIINNHKSRYFIFYAPIVIFFCLFLSTQIIWNVNVIDADYETEQFLLTELEKLGVKKGVFKFTIDQGEIKNKMLIAHEKLQWVWVDIKGGTALVRYSFRTPPPTIFDENAFYNVYATHDATITRMIVNNGQARVKVGDNVHKGQILIEGIAVKNAEETMPVHAAGEVYGTVLHEKIVHIPKNKEIRTPTGSEYEQLTINFLNFNIKLYINSSILYSKYDIIEDNRRLGPLPVNFNKKTYREVEVSYQENNIEQIKKKYEKDFIAQLEKTGNTVVYTESFSSDNGEVIGYTMQALCDMPIAQERRMNIGENYHSELDR